jgi:hypothetical protein
LRPSWPTKSFNADFLITYLVHPGTAVYVGYNSDLQNLDRRLIPTATGCSPLATTSSTTATSFSSRSHIFSGRKAHRMDRNSVSRVMKEFT